MEFPPASLACDDPPGLLAVGGDLSPERLLAAYSHGIFPWFGDDSPILWWSPDPRMVLAPSKVHESRSMRRFIRQQCGENGDLSLSIDEDFASVISQCASLRQHREGTWITEEMQQAYQALHRLGYAHSVEVWQQQNEGQRKLVGGLYGVALGRMFFGESMFSLLPNVSKLAFIALARQLQRWDFTLIDCQLPTEHLASLGARPMSREEFLRQLAHNRTITEHPAAQRWIITPDLMV